MLSDSCFAWIWRKFLHSSFLFKQETIKENRFFKLSSRNKITSVGWAPIKHLIFFIIILFYHGWRVSLANLNGLCHPPAKISSEMYRYHFRRVSIRLPAALRQWVSRRLVKNQARVAGALCSTHASMGSQHIATVTVLAMPARVVGC